MTLGRAAAGGYRGRRCVAGCAQSVRSCPRVYRVDPAADAAATAGGVSAARPARPAPRPSGPAFHGCSACRAIRPQARATSRTARRAPAPGLRLRAESSAGPRRRDAQRVVAELLQRLDEARQRPGQERHAASPRATSAGRRVHSAASMPSRAHCERLQRLPAARREQHSGFGHALRCEPGSGLRRRRQRRARSAWQRLRIVGSKRIRRRRS